jgi:hypothetical protein
MEGKTLYPAPSTASNIIFLIGAPAGMPKMKGIRKAMQSFRRACPSFFFAQRELGWLIRQKNEQVNGERPAAL